MVTVNRRLLVCLGCLGYMATATACDSFEDPNVVIDLRVLAMTAAPPEQLIDIDFSQPVNPASLLAQLVPTQVCTLIADPGPARRLAWSIAMCPLTGDDRCDEGRPEVALGSGVLDDPDTSVPAPPLCVTIEPDGDLLAILLDTVQEDTLRGLGGIDYAVTLRVGGEHDDRALDQYATKAVRVSPRIPAERTANTNPSIDHLDAVIGDAAPVALPLGRCAEHPAPYELPPGTKLRLTPVEPEGAREVYVVPTLDGRTQTFTESLTYQWIAGAGGFSNGSTGGPRDVSGNPPPLFSDFESPAADELDGPTDIPLWIIQRDERLGAHWYESCVRVVP